jgi:phage terminase large subunit-like protein
MKVSDKRAKDLYLKKLQLVKSGGAANPFESKEEQAERIAKAKSDVEFFVSYYLAHYATSKSAQFQIGLAKRVKKNPACKILVRWGRGLAKSVWCDVIIPLWLWINDDIHYMVVVGNNFDKAKILLSDLQAEFEANPRLKHDFGEQLMRGSWEDGYFRTKSGFIAKALGMGQSPRGLRLQAQRPDYIVCDDLEDKDIVRNPARQDQVVEWIEQDLLPTMDGPRRRYLHPNNNYAPRTIQEELHTRHPEWVLDQVNAYDPVSYIPAWPEKYDAAYYSSIETEVGLLAAHAEYNNKPHIRGKVFTEDQIQWGKMPNLNHFRIITGFWDVAYSGSSNSDYNAIRIWGLKDNNFWYIDSFVRQCKMRQALNWMAEYQINLPESVTVHWRFESQFWNDEVERTIRECQDAYGIMLNLVKVDTPKAKKYDRIVTLQPYYQNRRIYYNDKMKAHADTIVGLQQLYGIEPNYKTHDDAPDADQQAIEYLSRHLRRRSSQQRMGKMYKNQDRKL